MPDKVVLGPFTAEKPTGPYAKAWVPIIPEDRWAPTVTTMYAKGDDVAQTHTVKGYAWQNPGETCITKAWNMQRGGGPEFMAKLAEHKKAGNLANLVFCDNDLRYVEMTVHGAEMVKAMIFF